MRGPRGPTGAAGAAGATGATGAAAGLVVRAVSNGSRTPSGSFVGETCFSSTIQVPMIWDGVIWYAQDALLHGSRKTIFPNSSNLDVVGWPTLAQASPGGGPLQPAFATTNALTKRPRFSYLTTTAAANVAYQSFINWIWPQATFRVVHYVGLEAAAAACRWAVWEDSSATANPATDISPGNRSGALVIGADTGNANLQVWNNLASLGSPVDLGASFPAKTAGVLYRITKWGAVSPNAWNWEVVNMNSGAVANGTATPTGALTFSTMSARVWISNAATGAAVSISLANITVDHGDQ